MYLIRNLKAPLVLVDSIYGLVQGHLSIPADYCYVRYSVSKQKSSRLLIWLLTAVSIMK